MVTVDPTSQLTRTSAKIAGAVTVTVAALGAQICTLVAAGALPTVTVAAIGA